jgi:hypothetical protein
LSHSACGLLSIYVDARQGRILLAIAPLGYHDARLSIQEFGMVM